MGLEAGVGVREALAGQLLALLQTRCTGGRAGVGRWASAPGVGQGWGNTSEGTDWMKLWPRKKHGAVVAGQQAAGQQATGGQAGDGEEGIQARYAGSLTRSRCKGDSAAGSRAAGGR